MALWKRLLITVVAMAFASLAVGLIWLSLFDARIPSYLSGVIGGLAALATWELLRPK
ncbi:MAG: hypothetical protein OEN20_02250 [Gammaproteobacteria bacterium]|nr:hypothetical protein [Gammaproteobacteria bacterium]